MTLPTQPMTDLGNVVGDALLCAVRDSIQFNQLADPAAYMLLAGSSVPTVDACAGMVWVRCGTMMPSDGSGAQFSVARADFAIPAWTVAFEVGQLWCHDVIEEDGSSPEPSYFTEMALRDGQYRMAIMYAIAYLLPPRIESCIDGFTIDPWSPIGPDGGYSGGMTIVRCISADLAS